jgi:hypothetical protein
MKTNSYWTKIVAATVLCAASVHATDIPEGGDAAYHQLRASSDAVIADLRPSPVGYLFEVVQQIRGTAPATFYLDDEDDSDLKEALRVGQRYLLFLRKGRGGTPQLANSYYSAVAVEASDVAAHADFIRSLVKVMSDKAALKPLLMKYAMERLPYVSYSSVADLVHLRLLTSADVSSLARMLEGGQITEPRAKALVVGQVAKFRLAELAPMLERLAADPGQSILVRSRSLDALYQMNATASLRNLATRMAHDPSLHLRRKIIEISEKIR